MSSPDDDVAEVDTMVADSAALSGLGKSLAPAPLIGGRYELMGLLGSGAMGSVYRARDVELDEIVALKFLRSELVGSADMLERFRREVKLARRVTHPNVARVFDIGEHGGDKLLTMELIEGEPLSQALAREGICSLARALELIRPIAEGLAAAHAVGVVHRDLKPDNVMIAKDGRVVITDFGIARSALGGADGATMGVVVGTPAYMAPEQVECLPNVDQRADVYALGVMLFEMLTGTLPWQGSSAITVAAARLTAPPPDPRTARPDLPQPVADVVLRAMARRAVDRYESARELVIALEPLAGAADAPPAARPPKAAAPGASTEVGDKKIAVLPFANLGSADDAYVAEGLTEDLVDTLSMVKGLRVRPRSAVLKQATTDRDPIEVGRALDVQVVVEGSVRRRGDTLRVSARLVSVAEGFQLWARRFDRPAADALMVSDEVAGAVAQALTVAPASQHREAPTDPVAIDLYLRARAEFRALNKGSLRRSVELLAEANRRAPNDTTIPSAYARAAARLWFFGGTAAGVDANHVLELAERAVELSPERGEALLALAQIQFAVGNAAAAAELAARAAIRAPLLPEAHELVGRILLEVGPREASIPVLERALALDPLVEATIMELARAHALAGDYASARKLLDDNPAADGVATRAAIIARLALWSGERDEWLSRLPRLDDSEVASPATAAIVTRGILETGQMAPEFGQILETLMLAQDRPARFRSMLAQYGAELYTHVGDHAAALRALDLGVQAGLIDFVWFDACPVIAPLRGDPRFVGARAVVEKRALVIREAIERGRDQP